jgi:hypothetical protein
MNDRIKSILLISLLLMSTMSVGLTGTVAAQDSETIVCNDWGDRLSVWLTGDSTTCVSEESLEDIGGATAEEIQSNIYSSAGAIKQGSDTIVESQRVLNDKGENYVWGKAKVEIIEAHESQLSEAEAKERAAKEANEEYSRMQKALLDRMTTLSNEAQTIFSTVDATENLTHSDVMYAVSETGTKSRIADGSGTYNETVTQSYQLVNGESYNYSEFKTSAGSWDVEPYTNGMGFGVSSHSSDFDDQLLINGSRFNSLLSQIDTQASTTRSDLETFASDLYANYNPGTINASEFMSPQQIAQEYGLNSSEGAARSQITAALLGYETNANQSVTIEFVNSGSVRSGALFAENSPPTTTDNGTQAWITGETYVPSDDYPNATNHINGSVYLADSDGSWTQLEANFTVLSQKNAATGEEINFSTSKTYTQLTTNATNLSRSLASLDAAMSERGLKDDEDGIIPPMDGTVPFVLLALGGVGLLVVIIVVALVARSGGGSTIVTE